MIDTPEVGGIVHVADLIDPTVGEWRQDLVRSSFSDPIAKLILSIPLSRHPLPDRCQWFLEGNGVYSVRSGYKLLLRGSPGTTDNRYGSIPDSTRFVYNKI